MKTEQQLLDIINNLQTQLEDAKDELEKVKDFKEQQRTRNWLCNDGMVFYSLDHLLDVMQISYARGRKHDEQLKRFGNVFKTKEKAKHYSNFLLVQRQLQLLALRLNEAIKNEQMGNLDRVINYHNDTTVLYYIEYDFKNNKLIQKYVPKDTTILPGVIYCYDKNFLQIALEQLGEFNIMDYMNMSNVRYE